MRITKQIFHLHWFSTLDYFSWKLGQLYDRVKQQTEKKKICLKAAFSDLQLTSPTIQLQVEKRCCG